MIAFISDVYRYGWGMWWGRGERKERETNEHNYGKRDKQADRGIEADADAKRLIN